MNTTMTTMVTAPIMPISPSQASGRTWHADELASRTATHGADLVIGLGDDRLFAGAATAGPATKRHPGTHVWSPPI